LLHNDYRVILHAACFFKGRIAIVTKSEKVGYHLLEPTFVFCSFAAIDIFHMNVRAIALKDA
jgi:hypothetical protein